MVGTILDPITTWKKNHTYREPVLQLRYTWFLNDSFTNQNNLLTIYWVCFQIWKQTSEGRKILEIAHITVLRGHRGRGRVVVGLTTIFAIRAYHHWSCEFESHSGEVYSIQHYVIMFVNDLRQVGGFLSGFLHQ